MSLKPTGPVSIAKIGWVEFVIWSAGAELLLLGSLLYKNS